VLIYVEVEYLMHELAVRLRIARHVEVLEAVEEVGLAVVRRGVRMMRFGARLALFRRRHSTAEMWLRAILECWRFGVLRVAGFVLRSAPRLLESTR
jgi:hypothetical protein